MPTLPDDDQWLTGERRALGDRIRITRLGQNRTQESVFLAARLSRSSYQAIEAGAVDVRVGTLMKIARVLGVHVTDLLRA